MVPLCESVVTTPSHLPVLNIFANSSQKADWSVFPWIILLALLEGSSDICFLPEKIIDNQEWPHNDMLLGHMHLFMSSFLNVP